MKLLFCMLLSFAGITAFSQQTLKINPKLQAKYLIPEVNGLYIGAPEAAVAKETANQKDVMDNYVKKFTKGNIKEITYQLDSGFVYEIIVEYTAAYNVARMIKTKYKKPATNKNMLEIKLIDGLILKIWEFNNRLCIGDSRQFK
jgi:hypothetical protein